MQAAKKLPPFNEESLNVDINALEESAFAMGKLMIKIPFIYTRFLLNVNKIKKKFSSSSVYVI